MRPSTEPIRAFFGHRDVRLHVLALVLLLTACTPGADDPDAGPTSRQPTGAPSAPASSATIDGVKVIDRGLVPWEDGVVLDDPHVLRVMATGIEAPPTPCDEAVVVRAVRQSDQEVTVEARQYELAEKPQSYGCPSMFRGPQAHELRLDQPLAGRRVIDAATDAPREVIAFDDFPDVQEVPAGYQWRPPSWDDGRRVVTRTWGSAEGSLSLEIGPGKELQVLPAVLKRSRIRGQEAVVSRVIMLSCVQWGPADRTLNLCSRDAQAGDPPLGPDQLLAVGASVR